MSSQVNRHRIRLGNPSHSKFKFKFRTRDLSVRVLLHWGQPDSDAALLRRFRT